VLLDSSRNETGATSNNSKALSMVDTARRLKNLLIRFENLQKHLPAARRSSLMKGEHGKYFGSFAKCVQKRFLIPIYIGGVSAIQLSYRSTIMPSTPFAIHSHRSKTLKNSH